VPDATPIVDDQQQREHQAGRGGGHHEEISRDDLLGVIAQKRARGLRAARAGAPMYFATVD